MVRETPGTSESLNMTKTLQEQVYMRGPPDSLMLKVVLVMLSTSNQKEHFQCISLSIRKIL